MKVRHYQAKSYKLFALMTHATDPGVWPYFAQKLRRKTAAQDGFAFSSAQAEALYGPHTCDVAGAMTAIGLEPSVRFPQMVFPELFYAGYRKIASLRIPFRRLKIAGQSDLVLMYSIALGLGARDILETGVALGWSSLTLLKVVEKTNGHLVSVDLPYPFLVGSSWVGAVVPQSLHGKWTLIKQADRLGIPAAKRISNHYDLIHYDSDKSQEGRRWAYPRLWAALRPGGVMISDDIGDNAVWADFCRDIGARPIAVRRENALAGIVRKPMRSQPGSIKPGGDSP